MSSNLSADNLTLAEKIVEYFSPKEASYKILTSENDEIQTFRHVAHTMYFTADDKHNNVLMQMRFDGTVGFPGGFVDLSEGIADGLNREIEEEMGVTDPKLLMCEADELVTHVGKKERLVIHFFTKKVTLEQLVLIEQACLKCRDWGTEVHGLIRVPLFTKEKNCGFPQFLKHNFIGNSRLQLCLGLIFNEIMTTEDIKLALNAPHMGQFSGS